MNRGDHPIGSEFRRFDVPKDFGQCPRPPKSSILPSGVNERRIQAAVMVANQRTELAHIRLACRVIDEAKHL